MTKTIKGVCLILVLSILCTVSVSAEESATPRASMFFSATETYLYMIDGNRFGVWFDVIATGTMEELGVSTIVMQKSSDGTTWRDIKTFYPENYSQMIIEDSVYHADGVPYTGTYNYYYRAYVKFYAKNSTGSGYLRMYTNILHLQVQ